MTGLKGARSGGTEVGFIGLGSMGEPMVANLIGRGGYAPRIFDLRMEPVERLAARGARPGATPREVGAGSDIVGIIVTTEAQIDAVLDGPDGLCANARPGLVVMIHATVSPGYCRNRADALRDRGILLVDAPVSGGVTRAVEGSLSLFVGAEPDLFAHVRPVLSAYGSDIFRTGGVGTGQVAKIVNNAVALTNSGAVAEGLNLAKACGIDEDIMLTMLNASSGSSFISRNWKATRAAQQARVDAGGAGWEMAAKDLDLALALGRDARRMLPLVATMSQQVEQIYPPSFGLTPRKPDANDR